MASELYRYSLIRFFTTSEDAASLGSLRFDLVETIRSVVSLDLVSFLSLDPEIIVLRKRVAEIRARIGDLLGADSTERDSKENLLGEALAELVRERDGLERELRNELAERGAFVEAIRSENVASHLPEGSVAIGFLQTKGWRMEADSNRIKSRGDVFAAHLLKRDGSIIEVELGPAKELETLAAAWRMGLGNPIERGVTVEARMKPDERTAGETLRSRILDPILAGLDEETTTLMVCVDDFVHTLPLDALPLGEGRVGDRFAIVNLTSFRSVVSLKPPLESAKEPRLLAIGGIDYDALGEIREDRLLVGRSAAIEKGERSTTRPVSFRPLLQAHMEAEAVGVLFEQAFDKEPRLLEGGAAGKAAFARLAPGNRYLHIATHGWFAPMEFPEPDEGREPLWRLGPEERIANLSPMILCGLAFAGANRGRDALGRVPGILTAEELAGLDLSACELAVLSACETNVGIRSAGVGIQSLKAALHAAGVRTAITSLWKVDDAATRKLMELFYTYLWVDEMPKAKALWKAKTALRDDGHPLRDWAAWVLSGDPD